MKKKVAMLIFGTVFMSFQTFAGTKTCLCYGFSDDGYSSPVNEGIYAYEYEERCDSSSDDCWNVDVPYQLVTVNSSLENKIAELRHNEAICFTGSQKGNDYLVQSLVKPTAQDIATLACGKKLR